MTNDIILYKGATPCYIADNDTHNPLRERLELRIGDGGEPEYWIRQEGNGCGCDYLLEDVQGWTDNEITPYAVLDLAVLLGDAERVRGIGFPVAADWLADWVERVARARRNLAVERAIGHWRGGLTTTSELAWAVAAAGAAYVETLKGGAA